MCSFLILLENVSILISFLFKQRISVTFTYRERFVLLIALLLHQMNNHLNSLSLVQKFSAGGRWKEGRELVISNFCGLSKCPHTWFFFLSYYTRSVPIDLFLSFSFFWFVLTLLKERKWALFIPPSGSILPNPYPTTLRGPLSCVWTNCCNHVAIRYALADPFGFLFLPLDPCCEISVACDGV